MRFCGVLLFITFLLVFPTSTVALQSAIMGEDIQNGPQIDKVLYKRTGWSPSYNFMNNEFDFLLGFGLFDSDELLVLDQDPCIDLYQAPGNGYWCIDFDCRSSPFNISKFRRAFAYAFDKTRVTSEIMGGITSPHDSIVPYTSSFCIEEELDDHYYTDQADIGNQILDDLGLEVDASTGYRRNPNGDPFSVHVGYYYSQSEITEPIAQVAVEALNELHIYANTMGVLDRLPGLVSKTRPNIIVHDANFYSDCVDWLGNEFWNEISDIHRDFWIPTYFENSMFDLYRDDLRNGRTYNEVFDAAREIQKIIHHNVPRLVVCPKILIQPYRTDNFVGQIEDIIRGVSGVWSLCNIRSSTGIVGGTAKVGIPYSMNDYNIYTADTRYSKPFFENLWPSLFSIGPNLELIPNLASTIKSETHADNPAVPEGHTRITVDLINNATWSDGVPLTADDVVFTTTYELESGAYGNPAAQGLGNLIAAFAPISTKVIFEYSTESYWNRFNRATRYIIPKHIFNDIDGIGFEGWANWTPVLNSSEPYVTCGPFTLSGHLTLEYEMSRNPNYHYAVNDLLENKTGPGISTIPIGGQSDPLSLTRVVAMGLSFISIATIVIMGCLIIDHQRKKTHGHQ